MRLVLGDRQALAIRLAAIQEPNKAPAIHIKGVGTSQLEQRTGQVDQ